MDLTIKYSNNYSYQIKSNMDRFDPFTALISTRRSKGTKNYLTEHVC